MSGTEKRSTTLGDEHSETNRECQDIVDLSKQFPMFSEEPDRLRDDLKQSDINSTSLGYLGILQIRYYILNMPSLQD